MGTDPFEIFARLILAFALPSCLCRLYLPLSLPSPNLLGPIPGLCIGLADIEGIWANVSEEDGTLPPK